MPSPIDSGSEGGLEPIVPDSYTSTSRGAWRRRATFAAVLGRPMPTRHVAPSGSARAAATVIISAGVQPTASVPGASSLEDMRLHPCAEAVAVAADRRPRDVEVVVALRVAVGVRRL